MRILLATSNPHKLGEIQAVFDEQGPLDVQLVTLDALGRTIREPVEDQPTFEGNAVLKARYYADASGLPCLADDSGLSVDVLGGEPGVHSARYAGVTGPRTVVDPANNALLLERLGSRPARERSAKFVCVMALCHPDQAQPIAVVRGEVAGRIVGPEDGPRGDNGFGYDPLFYVASLGCTTAELSPEEKNAISHRGEASRRMWSVLKQWV